MLKKSLPALAFLLCLTLSSQIDSNLVVSFDFNEQQVKEDHNLVAVKAFGISLTEDRFGNPESALYLHGNASSYLNLGSSELLKIRRGTLSLWANIQSKVLAGKGYRANPLLMARARDDEDFNIAMGLGYSIPSDRFGTQTSKDSLSEATIYAKDTVLHNTWYHLAITLDDHHLALYVNGELQHSISKNFETTYLAGDSIVVGRSLGRKNEKFSHAIVDDIRFFHRVLSPEEIMALYKEPNPNRSKQMLLDAIKYMVAIIVLVLIIILLLIRNRQNLRKQKEFYELNNRVKELEIKVIKSQMNPHFISNSLAAIQHLIHKKEIEKAGMYLAKFSFFLRQVLDLSESTYISLKEELEMARLNVELEQLRFGENFSFELWIAEGINTAHIQIPSLIMQPFIENAIWHGLMPLKGRDPRLQISVNEHQHTVYVSIKDNGVGRTHSVNPQKKSRGTKLVMDKIESINALSEGAVYKLEIADLLDNEGKPSGTKVIIHLQALEE